MRSALVTDTFVPYILGAQNEDGGWGFHAGSTSRAEPTAWALAALRECALEQTHEEAVSRSCRWLANTQLPDGSWPSSPELQEGSWVTSLACLALLGRSDLTANVARGIGWLSSEVPGEARLFRRVVRSILVKRSLSAQNDSYFGWSWTRGTASWVEPTSYAIMLLRNVPEGQLSATAKRRLRLGEAMLYDRMCPGGGWNCGNPMVYGVPGEPQVSSTVWALLALTEHPERPEVQKSLHWLEGITKSVQSPGSLSLAVLALNAYGRAETGLADSLAAMYEEKEIFWYVPEVAWAALALTQAPGWLNRKPVEKG